MNIYSDLMSAVSSVLGFTLREYIFLTSWSVTKKYTHAAHVIVLPLLTMYPNGVEQNTSLASDHREWPASPIMPLYNSQQSKYQSTTT